MTIFENLEYIYVSFNKIGSTAYIGILLILHQKLMTSLYTQCCVLYTNSLYNFWLEFTLLSLPSTPKLVTI